MLFPGHLFQGTLFPVTPAGGSPLFLFLIRFTIILVFTRMSQEQTTKKNNSKNIVHFSGQDMTNEDNNMQLHQ
jgi:hypothetical protein